MRQRLVRAAHRSVIVALCVTGLGAFAPARASETGPVIVVPGRADVPVMMYGHDISYAVVEGDWGLARPSNINPIVIYRVGPHALIGPPPKAYYPYTGKPPRYGRKEVEPPPNHAVPPPAQDFRRSWSSQSDPNLPVTIMPPSYDMPPVIVAPEGRRSR